MPNSQQNSKGISSQNLQKNYLSVPSLEWNVCFLGIAKLLQDCVVHADKNGKILFENIFPIPMNTAGMISKKEFIMLYTRQKWYVGPEGAWLIIPTLEIFAWLEHSTLRTESLYRLQSTTFRTKLKRLCFKKNGNAVICTRTSRLQSIWHFSPQHARKWKLRLVRIWEN